MKKIDLSPEALNDLEILKEDLDTNYGEALEKKILRGIFSDLRILEEYPDSGSMEMFRKYGIDTDYAYLVTHKNYAFYRVDGDFVKIIRILDTRRDVIYTLFGIKTVEDYNDCWNEYL